MKKYLKILVFSLLLCIVSGCNKEILKEKEGVTVPTFEITINGNLVTNKTMESYKVYEAKIASTNTYGTDSETIYIGYKLLDILEAINLTEVSGGITATADDGYEIKWDDSSSKNNLIAFHKNDKDTVKYPWFAPCDSTTTGDYLKNCKTITIGDYKPGEGGGQGSGGQQTGGLADPVKDLKNNVVFGTFSFKVNGKSITNSDLAGLNIYKVSVEVENSKGVVSSHTYTGYVLKDVLNKLGVTLTELTIVASDSYESSLSLEALNNELTILAIECDKATGQDGTIWIAQCASHNSKDYSKLVVEIKNKSE